MKKLLFILCIISSFNSKGAIHQIQVWNGYFQFLPPNNISVQLGDTIQWIPLDPPTMTHTITSDNIPVGAVPFDQVWQLPADTFFQYIPQVAGLYQYVCTPHIPNGMIGEFTVTTGANLQTYFPDDNFETYLENNGMGNGILNDDYVTTANVNTVTSLELYSLNISDLTGVDGFTALEDLSFSGNQFTSLDLSNNTALISLICVGSPLTILDVSNNTLLEYIDCGQNQVQVLDLTHNTSLISLWFDNSPIHSLDLRNGNNSNFPNNELRLPNTPNLTCINVDDSLWATINFTSQLDPQHYFSNNCSGILSVEEQITNKELLKITDLLGRETKGTRNEPLFYIYDDGTVEKKIIIE